MDDRRIPQTPSELAEASEPASTSTQPVLRIDGSKLLDELVRVLERFVVVERAAYAAVALWIVHTYALDAAEHSPRLALESPQKRCGKTTLLSLLSLLVSRPLSTGNVTAAAIFHAVDAEQPTLLIDEADNFAKGQDDLRKIVNAGFEPGGFVLRASGRYSCFAPVALAAIGRLPSTIADRSIRIGMKRAKPGEVLERLRRHLLGKELAILRSGVEQWVDEHLQELVESDPDLPQNLDDRAQDCWRPLVAIADAAGADWGTRVREAAIALSGGRDAEDPESGTLLLSDLKEIFAQKEWIKTEDLLARLKALSDRPWSKLIAQTLASALRPYGIKPHNQRIGKMKVAKGYRREDFLDPWERYVPAPSRPPTPPAPRGPRSLPLAGASSVAAAVATPAAPTTSQPAADQEGSGVAADLGPPRLIWTLGTEDKDNPNKLVGVPTAYVGPTREHARRSCAGCPFLGNGCLAHEGRFNAVLAKIENGNAGDTLPNVLARAPRAQAVRLPVIGDLGGPATVDRAEVWDSINLARSRHLSVLGYTHFPFDPKNEELKGEIMASTQAGDGRSELENADAVIAVGWRPAAVLSNETLASLLDPESGRPRVGSRVGTPQGNTLLVCSFYTRGTRCADCRLCDPKHPGWAASKIHGVAFPRH